MNKAIYKATNGIYTFVGDANAISNNTGLRRGSISVSALQGAQLHGWNISYYSPNEEEDTYSAIKEHLDKYGNTIAMDDKMFDRLKQDGYNITTRFVREGEFWVIETKSRSRGNQERDCELQLLQETS